jgi:hypothetical protein
MDVIDNQYGFDQDKNIFYYYIKKKEKEWIYASNILFKYKV